MVVNWKVFRASFPYVCRDCGEFSSSEGEYCEKCGAKGSLRETLREDYEKHTKEAKARASEVESERVSRKGGSDLRRARRGNAITMTLQEDSKDIFMRCGYCHASFKSVDKLLVRRARKKRIFVCPNCKTILGATHL